MSATRGKRSALVNGSSLFLGAADERTAPARLFGELLAAAEAERGGRAAMTVIQRQAARQWAAITVDIERIHAEATATGKPLPEIYGALCDRARRQAERMGLPKVERRAPAKPQGHPLAERRPHPLSRKDAE